MPPPPKFNNTFDDILMDGVDAGHSVPDIFATLLAAGFKGALRSVERRKKELGLTNKKTYSAEFLQPILKKYFNDFYTHQRMLIDLKNNHGIKISDSTLQRHLQAFGLSRKYDDLDLENIDIPQAHAMVLDLQERFGFRLGYRGMRRKLVVEYDVHLHR